MWWVLLTLLLVVVVGADEMVELDFDDCGAVFSDLSSVVCPLPYFSPFPLFSHFSALYLFSYEVLSTSTLLHFFPVFFHTHPHTRE